VVYGFKTGIALDQSGVLVTTDSITNCARASGIRGSAALVHRKQTSSPPVPETASCATNPILMSSATRSPPARPWCAGHDGLAVSGCNEISACSQYGVNAGPNSLVNMSVDVGGPGRNLVHDNVKRRCSSRRNDVNLDQGHNNINVDALTPTMAPCTPTTHTSLLYANVATHRIAQRKRATIGARRTRPRHRDFV